MKPQTEPEDLAFDRAIPAPPGELVRVSPLIRRIAAGNPGPMTFTGTCTYVVGAGEVAVIDPGPDLADHIEALLEALAGETIASILVTHTHRDHSPAARRLKQATGARIVGCAPARLAPERGERRSLRLDAAHDLSHAPDAVLREGDAIEGGGFTLVCVETPGHAANHLAFVLPQEKALFTGDHVMAWSTSVIAPPDGSMRDYLASLEKLRERDEKIYWPGHGGPVKDPQTFVHGLVQHRRARERSILARLRSGDRTIAAIVSRIYAGLDPALRLAASLSVLAHMEDLVARGLVGTADAISLEAVYFPSEGQSKRET